MGKLTIAAPAIAVTTAVMLVAGCSGDHDDTSRASATPSASSPAKTPATDRAEHVPGESVTKAPTLPDGNVVAQAINASGNRELEIKGGLKSGALSVLVNCQGKGELTVSVKPVGMSFPLKCVDGEVSSTYNQLDLKRARTQGTVSVTAPTSVRWAITVGH